MGGSSRCWLDSSRRHVPREVDLSIVVSCVYPLLDLYFRPKPFERGGRLYKWMGILLFKRFVLWLGPKIGARRDRPNAYFLWDRSAAGISAFERRTRRSEAIHLIAVVLPVIEIASRLPGDKSDAGVFMVAGIILVMNLPPVLLQRYTRARIYPLLEKMSSTVDA
jgi:hypothetical protein